MTPPSTSTALTRRRLIETGTVLATTPLAFTPASAQRPAPVPFKDAVTNGSGATRRIMVESEFAPLRTVVLAQSQLRLPDADTIPPEQLDAEMAIIPAAQQDIVRRLVGHDLAEAMPDVQRGLEAEREALRRVFEAHGVEVLRPRLLTEYEKQAGGRNGYSNDFVRDPWFTVGNTVVEGSLRFPHRRREVLPSRDLFRAEVLPASCTYAAVPQPEVMPLEVNDGGLGPFLEGGDVLVHGRHIFVGHSGRASTPLGADVLRKLLAPQGYTVEVVRLPPYILHLDCAMGLVREGLFVVYEEGLLDGIPASLRGWDRIPASKEEATTLGTNGLPINPEVYVTDPAFRRIGDAVAARGVKVEYVDFKISRGFGGSFRCSTQPLRRE